VVCAVEGDPKRLKSRSVVGSITRILMFGPPERNAELYYGMAIMEKADV
jgi:hypothetical protein